MVPLSRDTPRVPARGTPLLPWRPAVRHVLTGGVRRRVLLVAVLGLLAAAPPRAGAAGPAARAGVPWAWGWNLSGQLGTGSTADGLVPAPVSRLPAVIALAAGAGHSLALTAGGTVWAWGNNDFGQRGTGGTTEGERPAPVAGLPAIVAVAAGTFHSLALGADGTVWAWGMNDAGQLGTGTACTAATPAACTAATPVRVRVPRGVIALAGGASWSLALTRAGTVWAWGSNAAGQLGTGAACAAPDGAGCQSAVPVPVAGLPHVTAIAAGGLHGLALTSGGAVWAWGANDAGQLGRDPQASAACGTLACAPRPQRVVGLPRSVAVAAGDRHSLALDAGGRLWTWGANGFGQLGVGTTAESVVPRWAALSGVVALAGGRQCSLALTRAGTVWAWGRDLAGTFAATAHEGSTTPEQVPGLGRVVALAQGSSASHSLVLVARRP